MGFYVEMVKRYKKRRVFEEGLGQRVNQRERVDPFLWTKSPLISLAL